MELSNEDALRLNVLLANQLQAIRIDESTMTVYGLSERGEAKVQLHPTVRDEFYLRKVRELISMHVLGSPRDYPAFLQRWNRMGQAKDDNLAQLLLLGEPTAIIAVVNASTLTPEFARRAWWAMPSSENARSMLGCHSVVVSDFGKVLAEHLIEHLPFEEEPLAIIDSVRLILQEGLIDENARLQLWHKGRAKNAYLVGFLWTVPDALPEPVAARSDSIALQTQLAPLIAAGNLVAQQIVRVTSSAGQTFIETCERVMRKPSNQDVVNLLFDVIANYFMTIRPSHYDDAMEIDRLVQQATHYCEVQEIDKLSTRIHEILIAVPSMRNTIHAMLILSGLRYSILRPIFSHTTAIGSLMRKKLSPISDKLLAQLAILRQPML